MLTPQKITAVANRYERLRYSDTPAACARAVASQKGIGSNDGIDSVTLKSMLTFNEVWTQNFLREFQESSALYGMEAGAEYVVRRAREVALRIWRDVWNLSWCVLEGDGWENYAERSDILFTKVCGIVHDVVVGIVEYEAEFNFPVLRSHLLDVSAKARELGN